MAKKEWAFASRTMGTRYFKTYGEAKDFVKTLNSRALDYDGEACIYQYKNGDWETYEELSCTPAISSRFGDDYDW